MEVSLESGVAVSVSPAEHETAKKFITNQFDGGHIRHQRELWCWKLPRPPQALLVSPSRGRSCANCTNAAISFKGFDMSAELLEVFVIIIVVTLIVGEETLVGCHRSHDTLGLGIVGAVKTLN